MSIQGKTIGEKHAAGRCYWQDVDRNGIIDADDRTKIGNPHPPSLLVFHSMLIIKELN